MDSNATLAAPILFEGEVAPATVGMSDEGVRRLAALFQEQVARGLHPGAQLVVLRQGKVVVDRAIGQAGAKQPRPITADTPFLTFSVSKALTGICVHKLLEEGKVELDAPIATYWPEFGCKGKQTATIRHAFLHQAGIPSRGLNVQTLHWGSWARVTRNVAALPAEFAPGSRTAYHLVNYGFILGEVVRRVTGQPIEQYLRQHFLEPPGLRHTWMGLPQEQFSLTPPLSYGHREQRSATLLFNLPAIRRAVVPAATLHSTARDLAIFYQMLLNGGRYAGKSYLRPETVRTATTLGHEGYDETIKGVMRWAYGFHLGGIDAARGLAADGSTMGKGSTSRTFGHFGNASCMAWADPDAALVVTFLCNHLLGAAANSDRWRSLSDAVWEAILPP